MPEDPPKLGVIAAMPEEIETLIDDFDAGDHPATVAMREYHTGSLFGSPCVLAVSRIGKVAAAVTATEMIARFNVKALILTGLAGALDPTLDIADIVIATRLAQHDLDASPIFPAAEIPLLGTTWLDTDPEITAALSAACERAIPEIERVASRRPRVITAPIVTGDQFIKSTVQQDAIKQRTPGAACVEMEGAAMAQVAFEHKVPIAVMRIISDRADHAAASDFSDALPRIASSVAHAVLKRAIPDVEALLARNAHPGYAPDQ